MSIFEIEVRDLSKDQLLRLITRRIPFKKKIIKLMNGSEITLRNLIDYEVEGVKAYFDSNDDKRVCLEIEYEHGVPKVVASVADLSSSE